MDLSHEPEAGGANGEARKAWHRSSYGTGSFRGDRTERLWCPGVANELAVCGKQEGKKSNVEPNSDRRAGFGRRLFCATSIPKVSGPCRCKDHGRCRRGRRPETPGACHHLRRRRPRQPALSREG